MIGFVVGSLCLAGLAAGRHRHRRHGWHQGYRYEDEHEHRRAYDDGHQRWGGFGRRFWLRGVFERLDATPAQEKVMLSALKELDQMRDKTRSDLKAARKDVAEAFRSSVFNEEAVGAATARIEGVMDEARKTGISIFAKVHDALDDHQRRVVADWISDGIQSLGRSRYSEHAYRGQC
jgi:Spy/CpxP family protein refolding chaperone